MSFGRSLHTRCILGILLSYNSVWHLMRRLICVHMCHYFDRFDSSGPSGPACLNPHRPVFSLPISIKLALTPAIPLHMHDSISGPHLRCITSNGLLCTSCPVLVRKQLWKHVGVRADLYGAAWRHRPAPSCGATVSSCWGETPVWPAPETPTIAYF